MSWQSHPPGSRTLKEDAQHGDPVAVPVGRRLPRPPATSNLHQVVGGAAGSRREELLYAAFARVAEVGFEGLRLRQVADDVGIDHSTLHHHFPTKQDLIDAVARYTCEQFLVTAPPEAPDAARRLRAHLCALQRLIEQRPELFTVTAELDLRARRDPSVRAVLDAQEAGWRAALVAVLTAAGSTAPEIAAEVVIATVKGVRLAPELAPLVFTQLTTMLAERTERPEGGNER